MYTSCYKINKHNQTYIHKPIDSRFVAEPSNAASEGKAKLCIAITLNFVCEMPIPTVLLPSIICTQHILCGPYTFIYIYIYLWGELWLRIIQRDPPQGGRPTSIVKPGCHVFNQIYAWVPQIDWRLALRWQALDTACDHCGCRGSLCDNIYSFEEFRFWYHFIHQQNTYPKLYRKLNPSLY